MHNETVLSAPSRAVEHYIHCRHKPINTVSNSMNNVHDVCRFFFQPTINLLLSTRLKQLGYTYDIHHVCISK